MKITLDRPRCEGHGLCEEAAPQLMHLDDDGELVVDVVEFAADDPHATAAGAAVRVCPVAALALSS
ncbi:ferredoxin [Rhodococcus artemisiae]|uniref:Ferredoxin n=1 Tax=Rhodococcus artemisiae TaxID=714159 RepID=A0ABU7L4T4_9NOCA|nr:ferredoxin [Rhodococcus artemisiae]MEE2055917.1 ferredoxin [Rhodococcus artemisiae]